MTTPTLAPHWSALNPACRRACLRLLAAEADDYSPSVVARLVGRLAPDCDHAERRRAWDELTLDVARLADLGNGLEWREVAPGAPANEGYSIAAEVLEDSISDQLDALCGGAG